MKTRTFARAVALFLISSVSIASAADLIVSIEADDNVKGVTSLAMDKPFWVVLTNNTDHDLAIPRYVRQDAQCLDIDLCFKNENKEDIVVAIGSFNETWNEVHPEVVGPKKSFSIKVDFGVGNWVHLDQLRGQMTMKAGYRNRMDFRPSKHTPAQNQTPSVWTGSVESELIPVAIVREVR